MGLEDQGDGALFGLTQDVDGVDRAPSPQVDRGLIGAEEQIAGRLAERHRHLLVFAGQHAPLAGHLDHLGLVDGDRQNDGMCLARCPEGHRDPLPVLKEEEIIIGALEGHPAEEAIACQRRRQGPRGIVARFGRIVMIHGAEVLLGIATVPTVVAPVVPDAQIDVMREVEEPLTCQILRLLAPAHPAFCRRESPFPG